ncbi:low-density lipoprotein receptor-related protein 5-like [Stylophora pistillata]|nr:low-density lipoprotein receptor-related protein 5-like [Stylophora pistillata]
MRELESITTHDSPIRKERSASNVAGHVLEQNRKLIPGMSGVHYVPDRLRRAHKSASPEKLYQMHQVEMKESYGEKRVKRDQGLQENYLLYAISKNSFTEIHKINLEDNSNTTLISHTQFGEFAGLDYNYKQNRLYWADSVTIYRSSLTGSGVEIVHNNLPAVKGIAVDWLGDNIFWTDASGIKVSRTDGRFIKTLISHPDYTGIVLDPERG